jgi:hypothetical protein
MRDSQFMKFQKERRGHSYAQEDRAIIVSPASTCRVCPDLTTLVGGVAQLFLGHFPQHNRHVFPLDSRARTERLEVRPAEIRSHRLKPLGFRLPRPATR